MTEGGLDGSRAGRGRRPAFAERLKPALADVEEFAAAFDPAGDQRHVANDIADQPSMLAVIRVQLAERMPGPGGGVRNGSPSFGGRWLRDPDAVRGACLEQGDEIREVVVDRVALYTRAIGDRADRRFRRADRRMELEGRSRDALPGLFDALEAGAHPIRTRGRLGLSLHSHVSPSIDDFPSPR